MTKRFAVAGIAALLGLTGVAPVAAQEELVGMWQCQQANQSLSNNAFENWMYEFRLALEGDGSFQAQGNYIAQTNGFAIPFYAQGGWTIQQGVVFVNGVEQQQGGMTKDFVLMFDNLSGGTMSNQYQTGSGRLLTYCQR